MFIFPAPNLHDIFKALQCRLQIGLLDGEPGSSSEQFRLESPDLCFEH